MHAAFAGPSLPPVPDPPETPEQEGVELGLGLLSRWPIADAATLPLPSAHLPFEPVALLADLNAAPGSAEHPIDGLHPSDHDAVVVDIALPTTDG